jgi:membrane-bound metal-dependent hydrolase YbcI (DUF457 family)
MPFTPLHIGPALYVKAALPAHFSLISFVLAQVAIDAEVAWNLATGSFPLHGTLHQLPGATGVGLASGLVAWTASRVAATGPVSLGVAVGSGAVGGVSHTLLDATMHADLVPFAPLVSGNPLLLPGGLYVTSVVCGILLATGPWLLRRRSAAPG